MNEEEDLCNFVAEIHTAMLGGLDPDGVLTQLVEQGFSFEDADKLVALALCVGRVAMARIEKRDDSEPLQDLDASGLHRDLCKRLLTEAMERFGAGEEEGSTHDLDAFAAKAGLDAVPSRGLFRLSQAIVEDINGGKTREGITVRLEASKFMPGEESEFVDHTLWAYQTAREIASAGKEVSDELLAGDPPWAVYTLLGFWNILREEEPALPNFSTPELALRSLEAAYRTRDIDAVMRCKDFQLESMFVLPGANDIAEDVRSAMVTVLEARFRDDMRDNSPEWNGIVSNIVGREDLPGDMVILSEQLRLPDGETVEMQHFVGKRENSWKVAVPYSDEMREAWLRNIE
jgi:hypothetical protein